jgi:membrane protein
MFTFIYLVFPNTKVNIKAALRAAIFSAILFEIAEWAYLYFQIGVSQYNQIYGSFAALPLFLMWIQISWFIVLFGAELAFSFQNVKHYELEHEINNLSPRHSKILSILILHHITKSFSDGKPPLSVADLSEKLDLPERLTKKIINTLEELGLVYEIKPVNLDSNTAYQPGLSEKHLTLIYINKKLESQGVNEIPFGSKNEITKIENRLNNLDALIENSGQNILLTDLMN